MAEGRTDFKARAPRKRNLTEMESEGAEARARRATEMLNQALEEISHQKRLLAMWMQRAKELEIQLENSMSARSSSIIQH